jgi:hypothetical protein
VALVSAVESRDGELFWAQASAGGGAGFVRTVGAVAEVIVDAREGNGDERMGQACESVSRGRYVCLGVC